MICENNKEFKFKRFSEECFKLCSNENIKACVKYGLKHNKGQDIEILNIRHYHLHKKDHAK